MRIKIELELDVSDRADEVYATAITHFIKKYSLDSKHTVEHPTAEDAAEAVEDVIRDILDAEFDELEYESMYWAITGSHCSVTN